MIILSSIGYIVIIGGYKSKKPLPKAEDENIPVVPPQFIRSNTERDLTASYIGLNPSSPTATSAKPLRNEFRKAFYRLTPTDGSLKKALLAYYFSSQRYNNDSLSLLLPKVNGFL